MYGVIVASRQCQARRVGMPTRYHACRSKMHFDSQRLARVGGAHPTKPLQVTIWRSRNTSNASRGTAGEK